MSKTLIHLPNWLGDCIMAMPAVRALLRSAPPGSVVGLCKPSVRGIWGIAASPLPLIEVPATTSATLQAARVLKVHQFERCITLSNSWRSAFIPFSAGIPLRRGAPGHWRSLMLSEVVELGAPERHLSRDYATLLGVPHSELVDDALLVLPEETKTQIQAIINRHSALSTGAPLFGLLPGAARGPSKRWPTSSYIALGKLLQTQLNGSVVVLGASNERELCREIAEGIGGNAHSFAGALSFYEGLAMIDACRAVVSNDSGGMHMAWALGRPLVAIFGITDPEKTGPLGSRSRVLQESDRRSRVVPRDCPEARAALARVTPEKVLDAVAALVAAEIS